MKLILAAALWHFATAAAAQAWPAKPIRFISSNAVGQGTEVIQRQVMAKLSQSLGQSIVVENVASAGAIAASQLLARAAPDGYTLGLGANSNLVLNRYTFKSLPYDPDRDFVPVGWLYDSGAFVVAVHPDLPVKTMPELIALAKANPGKYAVGAFIALPSQVATYLNNSAGIDLTVAPYKNIGTMVQDLLAGRLQVGVSSLTPFEPHMKAGKLRFIAITSKKRFPSYPDMPTVEETLPGVSAFGWGMLIAPNGTPMPIVQRINRGLEPIVTAPDYVKQLVSVGFTVNGVGTPESMAEFIRVERESMARFAKVINLKPE